MRRLENDQLEEIDMLNFINYIRKDLINIPSSATNCVLNFSNIHINTIGANVDMADLISISEMSNHHHIDNIIIIMPIMFDSNIEVALRVIASIDWAGTVYLYDIKSHTTQKWVRKIPVIKGLKLGDVNDVEGDVSLFRITWDREPKVIGPKVSYLSNAS